MQGVTGGHSFYINLDNNHQFYFGLVSSHSHREDKANINMVKGYCNPYAGGYKAGVHKASNEEVAKLENDNRAAQAKIAQKAYDESDGSGNMIKSELYSAKDKDGKSVIFQFQISASVGAKPVYIISEIRDYQTLVSKA
jgi:hypothetical protein